MNEETKKIYIILSYSGTFLSRLIKIYTRDEFCHVSIALDKDLDKMYSFGRRNPYNPFNAGFVHEGIHFGTFKRFKDTKVEIYSLKLTNEQYEVIKLRIQEIKCESELYSFNIVGLFATGLNIKYRKEYSFYCAEFVKYLTDKANINLDLPELVKPVDFKANKKVNLEYRGLLQKYRA